VSAVAGFERVATGYGVAAVSRKEIAAVLAHHVRALQSPF